MKNSTKQSTRSIQACIPPKEHAILPKAEKKKIARVDLQVFLLSAAIIILSCGFVFHINYNLTYKSMIEDLQKRALNIHDFLEHRLENASFYELNDRNDDKTSLYHDSKIILEDAKNVTGVRYLYTAKVTDDGSFIYLVDGLPAESSDFRYIGDAIEPECIPDMQKALSGERVLPAKINSTTWGSVFISYFPMHDGDKIIGVLGIEFDAQTQFHTYRQMAIVTPAVILISCLITACIAVLLFRRISNPSYRDMSNSDMLTGLKNRNAFQVDLHNMEQSAAKNATSLISVDLDNLKSVNDTFGHAAGDQYIQIASRILQSSINIPATLYRIGGDEFVVITQNRNLSRLDEFFAEIDRKAEEESKRHKFVISLSSGYASFDPTVDKDLSDTLKRADTLMYENKQMKKSK